MTEPAPVVPDTKDRTWVLDRPCGECGVWSPLEHACHVRDVHRVFAERLELMLARDEPRFAHGDQDDAVAAHYSEREPGSVDIALVEAAGHVAGRYPAVAAEASGRRGIRSDGSVFAVETLGIHHLHDVLHHGHDVGAS